MGFRFETAQVDIADGRIEGSSTVHNSLPGVVPISVGTLAFAANLVRYFPIKVYTPVTIDQLSIEVTTAGVGGTTARLGIYNANLGWQPTSLVVDAGIVAVDANAVLNKAVTQILVPGRYLLAFNTDGAPTLRCVRGQPPGAFISSVIGATPIINFLRGVQTYAAFPAIGTAWTTPGGGATPFDYAIFLRVLTP